MAAGANSYGAAADVAALTPRFCNPSSGVYDTTTHPSLAQVEAWINLVSSTLNILLAEMDFRIPITQADCILTLTLFVATEVSDLCNFSNSAGRFFQNEQYTTGPFAAIQEEAAAFIGEHAEGFEKLGAGRTTSGLNGLDARITDDAGEAIAPMFARKQFGNRTTNWDS